MAVAHMTVAHLPNPRLARPINRKISSRIARTTGSGANRARFRSDGMPGMRRYVKPIESGML